MKKIILCSGLVAMCLILDTFAICNYGGRELQTGEKVTISSCIQITCNEDGNVSGLTCPVYACKKEPIEPPQVDLSKPYPECCPKPNCGD